MGFAALYPSYGDTDPFSALARYPGRCGCLTLPEPVTCIGRVHEAPDRKRVKRLQIRRSQASTPAAIISKDSSKRARSSR